MMENRKIVLYVLAGAWDTTYVDGTGIVGIAEDVKDLKKQLEHIRSTKANEYLGKPYGDIEEESGERHYEITDAAGGYAKFYITEHYVKLSESLMGAISREMSMIDRSNDVKEHLRNLYESENLEAWKYEYIKAKPEIVKEIISWFEKYEDSNVSFNTTMENAVGQVVDELILDDEKLEILWDQFSDVQIDDDECILEDFIGFSFGTHREEVWHWFDKYHSKGVVALMYQDGDSCEE